jgi:hypothetical protein
MAFFRQYIAPFLVVLIFLVSLVAVSARIFLPADMAQPAPVEEVTPQDEPVQMSTSAISSKTVAKSSLSILINGLPEDPALSEQR